MPLLKNKALQKASMLDTLRDDEEVFHCVMTNEIFRDYEDFAERTFLCNSMVWSCEMTGKTNLTFEEAAQSEDAARKMLANFPADIRVPLLFLANLTKWSSASDMADQLYLFMKDRYFIGEKIEASYSANKWRLSMVKKVIAPTPQEVAAYNSENKKPSDDKFDPPAALFRYEVVELTKDGAELSQSLVVDHTQVKRSKRNWSKEKCRVFLRQHVTAKEVGEICISDAILDQYGIKDLKYSDMFAGPPVEFDVKRTKRLRQDTLASFLKNGDLASTNKEAAVKKKEVDANKRINVLNKIKEWYVVKEDLLLDNQVVLPKGNSIKCKIPEEYLGDAFALLDFVHSFSDKLKLKSFISRGKFTFEIMQSALLETYVDGNLSQIFLMFLSAIFSFQNKEEEYYKLIPEKPTVIKSVPMDNVTVFEEASILACSTVDWCVKNYGTLVHKLPLQPYSLSEVLRLHLLSSGYRIKDSADRLRYSHRGGYNSEDDPGLYFRLYNADIIKSLALQGVHELSLGDKLKLLHCLMDQLLTYTELREVLEDRMELITDSFVELRTVTANERKQKIEFGSRRKLAKKQGNGETVSREITKIDDEEERLTAKTQAKVQQLKQISGKNMTILGYDRAMRQYIWIKELPAVLIYHGDENMGSCIPEPVKNYPGLVNCDRDALMKHFNKLCDEVNTSDKENDSPKQKNGALKLTNGFREADDNKSDSYSDLLMCSSDPTTCVVHSTTSRKSQWTFLSAEEEFTSLLSCLNSRGLREKKLKKNLDMKLNDIKRLTERLQPHDLNPEFFKSASEDIEAMEVDTQNSVDNKITDDNKDTNDSKDTNDNKNTDDKMDTTDNKDTDTDDKKDSNDNKDTDDKMNINDKTDTDDKMEDTTDTKDPVNIKTDSDVKDEKESEDGDGDKNDFENTLVDMILTMEEKLSKTGFGGIQHTDRDKWRTCLENLDFDSINTELVRIKDGVLMTDLDVDSTDETYLDTTNQDPVAYIGRIQGHVKSEDTENDTKRVRQLARVINQVACSVNSRLKSPLGDGEGSKSDWERSLMDSTSYSQLYLHFNLLKSSIMYCMPKSKRKCTRCKKAVTVYSKCSTCPSVWHLNCVPADKKGLRGWSCSKCTEDEEKPEAEEEREEEEAVEAPTNGINGHHSSGEDKSESGESDIVTTCAECCVEGTEALVKCHKCNKGYHLDCTEPPLKRVPRYKWICMNCIPSNNSAQDRRDDKSESGDSDIVTTCAECCIDGSEGLVKCHKCHKGYHLDCVDPPLKRVPRHKWVCTNCTSANNSLHDGDGNRRSERCARDDLPLHNAPLQEFLVDVMKHDDAWPFLRPVQKYEVPDYYEIIEKPMDFGTIKYKLNMGKYMYDAELMADVCLIFENCNTYNNSNDEVYICGLRLLKYCGKRCRELNLKVPSEMQPVDTDEEVDEDDVNKDGPSAAKKRRMNSSNS